MLFDSIPIENYIFSLLHANIIFGNKRINLFYDWMTKHVEPLLHEEMTLSNVLIDLQILIKTKIYLKNGRRKNCTTIAELRIEKKIIDSLLKEKDDNNYLLIIGNYKIKRLNKIKEI